ncbi:MAG: putative two-component response regulator [bacterium]|nr:putative two-component response regulator [bacterium]
MRDQRQANDARPCQVLLAEDDAAMRELIARALRRDGFEVTEARNGYETLERLAYGLLRERQLWFDLVISDVRMPGYDGLNILASIKELPRYVPVILITAFGSAASHAAATRLGVFAMLDKPFDLDDLMTVVRSATIQRAVDGHGEV